MMNLLRKPHLGMVTLILVTGLLARAESLEQRFQREELGHALLLEVSAVFDDVMRRALPAPFRKLEGTVLALPSIRSQWEQAGLTAAALMRLFPVNAKYTGWHSGSSAYGFSGDLIRIDKRSNSDVPLASAQFTHSRAGTATLHVWPRRQRPQSGLPRQGYVRASADQVTVVTGEGSDLEQRQILESIAVDQAAVRRILRKPQGHDGISAELLQSISHVKTIGLMETARHERPEQRHAISPPPELIQQSHELVIGKQRIPISAHAHEFIRQYVALRRK